MGCEHESTLCITTRTYDYIVRGHSTTTWTEFCHFLRGQFLYPKRRQKQTFFDPLPPHLVHVVIKCPLMQLFSAEATPIQYFSYVQKCGQLYIKLGSPNQKTFLLLAKSF